jgi:hypothetical protein
MAVDFTQDSVSTLDLLAAVKTDRKQNCESCHKLRTVFFEESVDLTTCKELFAVVLRRDRFAKPKNTKKTRAGQAGVLKKALAFTPCSELTDSNGRVFTLQAAFVYKNGTGEEGHYQGYIMHPEERFYGDNVLKFSDANFDRVSWPPKDSVLRKIVMVIYSTK